MKVLVDTDAFCKLASCGLLAPALQALGCSMADARRLGALPFMVRRGSLARQLGADLAAKILKEVEQVPVAPEAPAAWLQLILDAEADIDPGEAQLLAVAADTPGCLLITGDKRALRCVHLVPGLAGALSGRVVTLEALMSHLCSRTTLMQVKHQIQPVLFLDASLKACFSSTDSLEGLANYQEDLAREVTGGLLWEPP